MAELTPSAAAALKEILGQSEEAVVVLDGRKVLVRVLPSEGDFDLDSFLEKNPAAARSIERGLADLEAGRAITQDEIERELADLDG